jgi:hydrogenase maturation protein HypF
LTVADGVERPEIPAGLVGDVGPPRWDEVCELVRTGVASQLTTSMGRLFDAVAAICGLRARVNYEGQAAAELEAAAEPSERGALPVALIEASEEGGSIVIDVRETVRAVRDRVAAGDDVAAVSARFHNALAAATADALAQEAERRDLDTVVLSGGVFQNRLLLERTIEALGGSGLRLLTPRLLPPNDGGISFGQAAVAAAIRARWGRGPDGWTRKSRYAREKRPRS